MEKGKKNNAHSLITLQSTRAILDNKNCKNKIKKKQ